jgi:hypothetical protein
MRMRMTHARFEMYIEELPKRAWPDGCGHKDSEYIGSVLVRDKLKLDPVDVYIHEGDLGVNQAHVCVRYGASGCEYMSAGTVMDFLATCAAKPDFYPEVAALILKKLDFFCERKEENHA